MNPSYATAHQWRAVNLLVTGHPAEGAQALDPAFLIIMAMTFGLILPRMLFERVVPAPA